MRNEFEPDSLHPLAKKVIRLTELVSRKELYKRTGLSKPAWFYYLSLSEEFPKRFLVGKREFYLRSDVEAYLRWRERKARARARNEK